MLFRSRLSSQKGRREGDREKDRNVFYHAKIREFEVKFTLKTEKTASFGRRFDGIYVFNLVSSAIPHMAKNQFFSILILFYKG